MSLSKYSVSCAYLRFLFSRCKYLQREMSSVWHERVRTLFRFVFLSVWVTPGCEEPSAFVTANQTKWGRGGREDCSSCILWGFFRSASNLYATRAMGIPRDTIPLVSETMQNATLISTDFSVECSASQAIELGAQSLVFQPPPQSRITHRPSHGTFFFPPTDRVSLPSTFMTQRTEPDDKNSSGVASSSPLSDYEYWVFAEVALCGYMQQGKKKKRHLDGRERRRRCFLVDAACGETVHLS